MRLGHAQSESKLAAAPRTPPPWLFPRACTHLPGHGYSLARPLPEHPTDAPSSGSTASRRAEHSLGCISQLPAARLPSPHARGRGLGWGRVSAWRRGRRAPPRHGAGRGRGRRRAHRDHHARRRRGQRPPAIAGGLAQRRGCRAGGRGRVRACRAERQVARRVARV